MTAGHEHQFRCENFLRGHRSLHSTGGIAVQEHCTCGERRLVIELPLRAPVRLIGKGLADLGDALADLG